MDRPASPKSESIDLSVEAGFHLGGGRVDPPALQYATRSEVFRLQPQTMKVLVALHDRSGHVVTRDEMIDRCWDRRIVGDDVINRAISLLRPLAAASGRFSIETIPRSGYRLIEEHATNPRRYFWIGGIAFALIAIIAALMLLSRGAPTDTRRALVVTVMPFTVQPGNGADRLAAEVQDSVIRILTDSGLSVKVGYRQLAPDRDADLSVSGFVSANSQGAVATVRLEDLHRHVIVLSHRLTSDVARLSDLPDRVGAHLASALSWTGPLILIDEKHPSDPAFMMQLLDSDPNGDPLTAFEFARRNAPNAPNSAIAQFMLAMATSFALVEMPREQRADAVAAALAAADRVRQLAPNYGDVAIPWCLLHSPTLLRACEDRLRAGLPKDAQAPFATNQLSTLMNNVGRTEDAVALADASLAEDRYVSYKMGLAVELHEATGRTDAERIYKDAQRLWPDDLSLFWRRAQGMLKRGDFKALDNFERAVGEKNFPPDYHSSGAVGQALRHRSPTAFASACPKSAQGIQALQCMVAASMMGELDQAYLFAATLYPRIYASTPAQSDAIWLKYPYEQDTGYLTFPSTAAMRRDPRFLVIADGVGLLHYWRGGRLPDFCTKAHEAVCAQIVGRRT